MLVFFNAKSGENDSVELALATCYIMFVLKKFHSNPTCWAFVLKYTYSNPQKYDRICVMLYIKACHVVFVLKKIHPNPTG